MDQDRNAGLAPKEDPGTLWDVAAGSATRLTIIDRRELFRESVSSWLRTLRREFVISTSDAAERVPIKELLRTHVIIFGTTFDLASDRWLQHGISWLLSHRPDAPILVVVEPDNENEAKALVARWNLRGYIPTSSTRALVGAALDIVTAGGIYLPRMAEGALSAPNAKSANAVGFEKLNAAAIETLTSRERAVLALLRQGLSNKVIAYRLGISKSTVKAHLHSLMVKLHVHNRTEAAVVAQADGSALPGLITAAIGK